MVYAIIFFCSFVTWRVVFARLRNIDHNTRRPMLTEADIARLEKLADELEAKGL